MDNKCMKNGSKTKKIRRREISVHLSIFTIAFDLPSLGINQWEIHAMQPNFALNFLLYKII